MVRLENVAVPVASVVCVKVPPRVAVAQDGVPLNAIATLAFGIGVLVLSVTNACTAPVAFAPVRTQVSLAKPAVVLPPKTVIFAPAASRAATWAPRAAGPDAVAD